MKKKTMFEDWYEKRVILWTTTFNQISYVGTLVGSEGQLVKLIKVTPVGEHRNMPDMVANLSCPKYSSLTLVDKKEQDPTGGK